VIQEYAERLARALAFDPALAHRVRQEVEDHLRERAANDPVADRVEAERRAVASFGDPRAIAAQFAAGSLARQARRAGFAAILVIGAAFIAMKARLTWYGLMELPAAGGFEALAGIVLSIDRLAFWLALVAGIAAWIYISSRRLPASVNGEYRSQLRRFFLMASAAAGALALSIAGDAVLTSLRLYASGWSTAFLVPLLTVAIEVACAGAMLSSLRRAKLSVSRFWPSAGSGGPAAS